MFIVFVFELILKAALLTLGILAAQGKGWAFVTFIVLLCVLILVDIVLAITVASADRNIERRME